MKKKYFKWFLVIGWMAVIFMFSNEPAVISDQKSMTIVKLFKFLGLDVNGAFASVADFMVRKAAHFTEYFILYLFVFNALKGETDLKKALWISLVIVFLYASTDEIHQIFIPGRTCRFRDVLIDTGGGLLGYLINSKFCESPK